MRNFCCITLEIVDPQGRIRELYSQADVVSSTRLMNAIKALLPPSSSE